MASLKPIFLVIMFVLGVHLLMIAMHVAAETDCKPIVASVFTCMAMAVCSVMSFWTGVTDISGSNVETLLCIEALMIIMQIGNYNTVSDTCEQPLVRDIEYNIGLWGIAIVISLIWRVGADNPPVVMYNFGHTMPFEMMSMRDSEYVPPSHVDDTTSPSRC